MVNRSDSEWRRLVAEQVASGLSAAAFCRKQGLCPKHFSLRRKQLGAVPKAAESKVKQSAFSAAKVPAALPVMEVHWQEAKLRLPVGVSALWVASLLKALG